MTTRKWFTLHAVTATIFAFLPPVASRTRHLLLSVFLLPQLLVGATEYFVAPEGSDSNDGISPLTAFASIQRGLDQLHSGDTLVIAPGEYYEAATIENIGTTETTTTIRAAIPGTAILRGDIPAPEFKLAEGYNHVYVATLDSNLPVQVVNERNSVLIHQTAGNISELEFNPGAFYHDTENKRLYLSTSDALPPDTHDITLTVLKGDGLLARNATNLVIEGIGATGFNIGGTFDEGGTGIALENSRDSVIRNCTAWFNGFGIEIRSAVPDSGGNRIEDCLAWGNSSPFATFRRGGITALRHRNDTIRNSEAYYNSNTGIYLRIHGDNEVPGRIVDSLAWGNRWDLIIKTNPLTDSGRLSAVERSIGHSIRERSNPQNGLYRELDSGNYTEWPTDTIFLNNEKDLEMEAEFADPLNRDYRLQATSRFRNTAPDGGDRGPLPYQGDVYFVSAVGDDTNDGLSASASWQTLQHAASHLQPGDTLYIEPGEYADDLTLTAAGTATEPISIRGRGREPVVLKGTLVIDGSRYIEVQRLHLSQPVIVQAGEAVAFSHCTFTGYKGIKAQDTNGLTLEHCQFGVETATAVSAHAIRNLVSTGNHFLAPYAPAIVLDSQSTVRYADYNAWPYPPQEGWNTLPTSGAEAYSIWPNTSSGAAMVALLQTRGPLGKPLGPFFLDPLERPLELLHGPNIHSTSATTANIEWLANLPCTVEIAWGTDPDHIENRTQIDSAAFGTFSLTGLLPGTTYYARILSLTESMVHVGQDQTEPLAIPIAAIPEPELLTFTTSSYDRDPVTWHVSPAGDNGNDGTNEESPLATIQAAADRANVGDTILIESGEYIEQVRIRSTGSADRPITFRAVEDGEVTLSAGPAQLQDAFSVHNKAHLRFDHMNLLSMLFNLYRADDIEITRIFAGRYSRNFYAPGFVYALRCDNLLIANSVALSAKNGPRIKGCANVVIRNCVFYRNMIGQLQIESLPGDSVIIKNCIFTDGIRNKLRAPMIDIARKIGFREANNCYYPRYRTWDEKSIIRLYSDEAFERARIAYNVPDATVPHPVIGELQTMSFAEMQKRLGDNGSILANPRFAGLAEYPETDEAGDPVYSVDRMTGSGVIPFHYFFATNPKVVARGMGLQPEVFSAVNSSGNPVTE